MIRIADLRYAAVLSLFIMVVGAPLGQGADHHQHRFDDAEKWARIPAETVKRELVARGGRRRVRLRDHDLERPYPGKIAGAFMTFSRVIVPVETISLFRLRDLMRSVTEWLVVRQTAPAKKFFLASDHQLVRSGMGAFHDACHCGLLSGLLIAFPASPCTARPFSVMP
jgi:hypothetical protein